jgi:hypothetical protein
MQEQDELRQQIAALQAEKEAMMKSQQAQQDLWRQELRALEQRNAILHESLTRTSAIADRATLRAKLAADTLKDQVVGASNNSGVLLTSTCGWILLWTRSICACVCVVFAVPKRAEPSRHILHLETSMVTSSEVGGASGFETPYACLILRACSLFLREL